MYNNFLGGEHGGYKTMQEQSVKTIVSKNLQRLRGEISKIALAKKLGISSATVGRWEHGKNLFPIEKLPKILRALDCTINELFSPLFDYPKRDQQLESLIELVEEIYHFEGGLEKLETMLRGIYLVLMEGREKKRVGGE